MSFDATLNWTNFDNVRKSLRFLKQEKNWDEIITEALNEWSSEIESDARRLLRDKVNDVTGRLANNIFVIVDEDGDLALKSYQRYARVIDKGYDGEMPFPNVKSKTIIQYAKEYGIKPYVLARGIHQNQPFAEGAHFSWTALWYNKDNIKKEIYIIAKRRKKEAIRAGTY